MTDKKYIADNAALMQDWDFIKNSSTGLDPYQLTSGSNKRAWWRCAVCGNEWETQIIKRAVRGQGCPTCARQKQNEQQAKSKRDGLSSRSKAGELKDLSEARALIRASVELGEF